METKVLSPMDIKKEALKKHYEWAGKLEVTPRAHVQDRESLSLAYTPGVAEPCLEIQRDIEQFTVFSLYVRTLGRI